MDGKPRAPAARPAALDCLIKERRVFMEILAGCNESRIINTEIPPGRTGQKSDNEPEKQNFHPNKVDLARDKSAKFPGTSMEPGGVEGK